MVNSEKRQSGSGRRIDDVDPSNQASDGQESVNVSSSHDETPLGENQSVARRLTEIFVDGGDGDLLLQRSDREDGFLQWLRALDMQVMGACRADERLKPLLKLNVSTGVAEDRLLAQLNQHFEPAEVGMLARCLCLPLVSIRVGKIDKQGTLLSPTSTRGVLCLTLLPTSNLRLSFNDDDGSVERLLTISTEDHPCTEIDVQEISADTSGRSFFIKVSDTVVSYFWCSEKSMLLGSELLRKMRDLLVRKPTLAELSGISEYRLNCFASHLRAYLAGSMLSSSSQASSLLSDDPVDSSEHPQSSQQQQHGSRGSKADPSYHDILRPRSSSFKESQQRREKTRHLAENYVSSSLAALNSIDLKGKVPEVNGTHSFPTLSFLDVVGKSAELLPGFGQDIQRPSLPGASLSPHYCWCPPVGSALPNPQLPISSSESLSLPPLSSLLSSARASVILTSEIPSLDFPDLPVDSSLRLPISQQIPTFTTPLICCDPIVHIPVIDVFSSGQGYLVSTGPAMPTTIPPLNPNLVDPLLPNAESVVEKSARETLRMLISGTSSSNQTNQQLLEVLNGSNDKENTIVVTGSRGLYTGTRDISAIATMGLVLLTEKSKSIGGDDQEEWEDWPSTSGPSGNEGID